jgi:hypothetical protein
MPLQTLYKIGLAKKKNLVTTWHESNSILGRTAITIQTMQQKWFKHTVYTTPFLSIQVTFTYIATSKFPATSLYCLHPMPPRPLPIVASNALPHPDLLDKRRKLAFPDRIA